MAKVQRTPHERHREVFASVFSGANIRPPKNQQRFRSAKTTDIDAVVARLHEIGRERLGIGSYEFSFPLSTGQDFHTSFAACPSLTHLDAQDVPARLMPRGWATQMSRQMRTWTIDCGAARLERCFARVIDKLITEFINWSYAQSYEDSGLIHLRIWVEQVLIPHVHWTVNALHTSSGGKQNHGYDEADFDRWYDMALTRFATLRTAELFDVVVDWDNTTSVIDDLKQFTTNPATRGYLTTDFAGVLSTRLLHPGASTIEILQLYISIIRAFTRLDPKGVLLDRVARKVRRYLRERDDTIKVVVAGLLSDVSDKDQSVHTDDNSTLNELAVELQRHDAAAGKSGGGDLDWNNMEWLPDPIDAAPDYMKSRSTDVVGSLISLFDTKDVFVRELQTVLADRLLKNKSDFDQEISVVEHLKIRLGDSSLQGCEVMLRDVLDSRKVNHIIRQEEKMNKPASTKEEDTPLHAKILSRLFWPSLQEQSFKVPQPILDQQTRYEKGFESLKQTRKLTWLNAIGQVEVELEFEDRTFYDEVLPWQASVIYAFQESTSHPQQVMTKTISDLSNELEMSPALVRSACMFWLSKRVLTETARDTYSVLETLPTDDNSENHDPTTSSSSHPISSNQAAASAAAADLAAAQAIKEAEEAERKQKMAMYHQFILSMLTNQGAMPLPRIAMMLGIVVPGGFPFGNEELKEFMGGMVRDGVLVVGAGGAYKVAPS